MAGHGVEAYGGKTTLQQAAKPAIDALAAAGRSGMFESVPEGFEPGSEIANMSVLGYDVAKVFEGRGSLEAASMGVEIEAGEMAMRCNLITIEGENIKNHSAGHITTEEATELMEFLQRELGDEQVSFYPGVSYRHLMKIKGGDKRVECTPPHNVPGEPFRSHMVKAECDAAQESAELLNRLILRSQELLATHPVNLRRVAAGKSPANSIWMWSPGYKPAMETLAAQYPHIKSGSVISAVDLIKGIGIYAGLNSIDVEGATGLYDTNYEGKVEAAIEALRTQEFVYLHIEASDEAGHEGDHELKVRTIENLSERAVKPIMAAVREMESQGERVRVALLPDHPTPCHLRTHTREDVPFVIYETGMEADAVMQYDEESAKAGAFGRVAGDEFIKLLLN